MTVNKNGASPDKRRKHDEAFKAEALPLAGGSHSTQVAARQLGIRPKLLYRWQRAQLVAEIGSEEVARDPEVRALRARLKRAEQELLRQRACPVILEPFQSRATRWRLLPRPDRSQARNQSPHGLLQCRAAAFRARLPRAQPLRNLPSNDVQTLSGLARPPQYLF